VRTKFLLIFLVLIRNISTAQEKEITVSAGVSTNISDLKWSIAGNMQGQSPNILSELKFNSITSVGYYIEASYKPLEGIKLFAHYQNSETINGHGTDIDYQNDDRQIPTYNLSFASGSGKLNIFRTGINTPLIRREKIDFSTGLNYQYNSQIFYILRDDNAELESTYKAKTEGVELYIETSLSITRHLTSSLYMNGGYVKYIAIANWNLQNVFMHPLSFMQISKGMTTGGGIDIGLKISPIFNLFLDTGYDRTAVFKGVDTSYLSTGIQMSTQLNGVNIIRYYTKLGVVIKLK
jgi:hypothetical protein